jgi:anti-repressor protein
MSKESKVTKFDHKVFGQLRVVIVDGKEMFVANDVANILGYKIPKDAVKTHCKSLILLKGGDSAPLTSSPRGINVIPEKDVYRLIMRSNLPQAEDFQDWVMEHILPTLRKSGGYVSDVDQIINTFYKNEDPHVKEVIRAGLNFQKDNQHKVDFFGDVADVSNLKTMNDVAKAFGAGRNKLYAKLREMKILMEGNSPYQQYCTQGYFKVKQITRNGILHNVTLVTGKGELWLHKKLKELTFI